MQNNFLFFPENVFHIAFFIPVRETTTHLLKPQTWMSSSFFHLSCIIINSVGLPATSVGCLSKLLPYPSTVVPIHFHHLHLSTRISCLTSSSSMTALPAFVLDPRQTIPNIYLKCKPKDVVALLSHYGEKTPSSSPSPTSPYII